MTERHDLIAPIDVQTKARWLPFALGGLLLALSVAQYAGLQSQEKTNLAAKSKTECDFLASRVDADLRSRLPVLSRIARSWELRGGMSIEEFSVEARSYLADVPGFQALELVGPDSVVRAVVPLEGNEKALGLDLSFEKSRRDAMARARDSRSATMTPPVELVQGGKGFVVFFPLFLRGEYKGLILAVFRIQEWLDYVFSIKDAHEHSEDFKVAASVDGRPVYEQDGWPALADNDRGISSSVRVLDHDMVIHVRPTESFERGNRSPMPWTVLAYGCVFSVLSAFGVMLYQRSTREARRARAASEALRSGMEERQKLSDEFKAALFRMEWATRSARMGVWTWDLPTDRLDWNERMFELYDIPPDVAPTYATWKGALHPEDAEAAETLLKNAVAGKATFDTEFRCVLSNGASRFIKATARVERDAEGRPRSVTGLNWDVSLTKLAEEALRQSEEKVRLLLNSTGEAIYGIDLKGDCTFANPACARLLGYPEAGMFLGRNMHNLIHHSYADGTPMPVEDCRIFRAFHEGKPMHVDDEVLWRMDGSSFPSEYWSYPQVAKGEVLGAVVTFIDITKRRADEETIRHMATHDGMTDLPRMPLCRDRLQMAMGAARRAKNLVAVMFLDLDGFKDVNDSYGHDAGDEVLREVARRLRSILRETDTAARVGGDEFILIITELHAREDAAEIARKAIQAISQPIFVRELRIRVGTSVGVSFFPGDADSVDSLVKLADEAMYRVKKGGKNGFGFAPAP